MAKKYWYIYILLFIVMMPKKTLAQENSELNKCDSIISILQKSGYENLQCFNFENDIILAFENRVYRYDIESLADISEHVLPLVNDYENLQLILKSNNIPVIQICINVKDINISDSEIKKYLQNNMIISSVEEVFLEHLKGTKETNKTFLKSDIVFHPDLKVLFGDFNQPARTMISINPEFQIPLWKGAIIFSQTKIILHNDLDEYADFIRPKYFTFNQMLQAKENSFISLSAGLFSNNRYGFDIDSRKFFNNRRLSIGANIGITGYAEFSDWHFNYDNINRITAFFDVSYFYPQWALHVKTTVGRFIYKDYGVRFDIGRQLNEVWLNLFLTKTNKDYFAGLSFLLPIWPKKRNAPKRFRLQLPKYYDSEYTIKGPQFYCTRYETRHETDRFFRYWHPKFTRNQMTRILKRK